ncbi:hypothetical protein Q7M_1420 (plasmid) [Borrelia crocidurae str. Achema]|uniref:Uncharacterized protein n=1 Tax=Borrelia crocidurae (strain Achema) TaxID=1155096 RepID=I0FFJ0_BORCA|nr:hypothetical protein Q7M_1420 [Borrelia crocidurae str. Achema]
MEVREEIRSYVGSIENSDSSDDIAKLYPLYEESREDNITMSPPRSQINTNFEGFKTTKGLSLASLGIMFSYQEQDPDKDKILMNNAKEEMI